MAHYPGYTVLRTEDCPEQHGTLTLLTHDVSGAAVLLVENEDVNKAFGIGFGTFPSDDTGVFHILEHSVLAGSEKYPVSSPFVQLLKSSMASFLNAMTFPDKTVYPFATPNETDFCNLMDVYLNAVFCPLAMVDSAVFEQEGWHRDADGTVSGVVYNEMQGALASPDAQLQNALQRAMFPDTAYGFVSGGDPASIPALTYEKYQRVYRRHYSADNCCITLYGKMDMADKLARLDQDYLSKMPKAAARPRLTMQDEQPGAFVELPYYTDQPKPDEVQCALAWYTGAFADRERQLGVEILLGALLSTNSSPLKAALLAEQLGADIDIGFDDSTLQPTLELLLRGATVDSARKFAPAVRKTVDELLKTGIPHDLLLAALNEAEFASLERPGSLPDGVLDAINAATGWLHTGDAALLLHTDKLFAALRSKLEEGWFDTLLRELFAPAPVQVVQIPTAPKTEDAAAPVRTDGKLVLEHPLTAADLGAGDTAPQGSAEQLAGATLLRHPSAGSLYLNFYYDLGSITPEELQYLNLLTDVLDELDTPAHTAQQLNTLRSTWLGDSRAQLDLWTGRQEGSSLPREAFPLPEPAGAQPGKGGGDRRRVAVRHRPYRRCRRSRLCPGGQSAEAAHGAAVHPAGQRVRFHPCPRPLLCRGRCGRSLHRRELLSLPVRSAGKGRLGGAGRKAGCCAQPGAAKRCPDRQPARHRGRTGKAAHPAAGKPLCRCPAHPGAALHPAPDAPGERSLYH